MAKNEQTVSETQAAPAMPAMTPEQFTQFMAMFMSQNANNAALAQSVADIAGKMQKQMPENVSFPDASAYNPLGERDNPRPEMPCPEVFFGGFPVERDQLDIVEAMLITMLQPGEVRATKVDGESEKVRIGFKRNDSEQLERITIQINTGKEHKHAWPGMREVLAEMLSQQGVDVYPLPTRGDAASTTNWLARVTRKAAE